MLAVCRPAYFNKSMTEMARSSKTPDNSAYLLLRQHIISEGFGTSRWPANANSTDFMGRVMFARTYADRKIAAMDPDVFETECAKVVESASYPTEPEL